jgi:hypothetical protein
MQIDTADIRRELIEAKQEALALSARARGSSVTATIDMGIRLIERLLLFLAQSEKEGVIDMKQIKAIFSDELIDIDDIERTRRPSELENMILEKAKEVPVGKALPVVVGPDTVSQATFVNKVYDMIAAKKLTRDFVPMRSGGKTYLARLKAPRPEKEKKS